MLSIVLPIYNEAACIPSLYDRLVAVAKGWNETVELIFVNDGSQDQSLHLLKERAEKDSRIRIISFSRNFGHQAAVSAGIEHSKGDAVVIMDSDLQDPPEELSRLIEKWREGYEVVYAVRASRAESTEKQVLYQLFYRILSRMSDVEIPVDSGDFCLMDRKVVNVLKHELPERIRFVRGLRAFAGFKQIGIPYDRPPRAGGETKYSWSKLFGLAFDGIFGFSLLPLRLASFLGFAIAIPSFLVGIFFVIHRIFRFPIFGHYATETPGLASLAVGVFFLGGIFLIILGIIGEYLGRIYIEVKQRPTYIISEHFPS